MADLTDDNIPNSEKIFLTPEQVAEIGGSYTGKFLKNLINGKMKKTA